MLERLRRSTRARILLAFVLVLAFAGLVTTVLLRQVLLARADARVDANLEQEVEEFRILVAEGRDPTTGRPFGSDVAAIFDVFLARNVPGAGEAVFTFLEGRPYRPGAGGSAPPAIRDRMTELAASVPRSVRGELREGDAHVRYLAVPVRVQGRRRGAFAVVGDLREAKQEAAAAGRVAAFSSAVALLFAGLLGLVVTGRTLRPLRDMATTARSISESDLTRRIPVSGHDEIGQLGRTFNQMLDRLQRAFDSQRALVSDAGHELRTPITIIRGHLELLGDDPQERVETMAVVQDELDRMSRLVDDLLTLAKAERSDFLRPEPLDLDVLTAELHAKAQRLGPQEWRLGATGTGTLVADRQRLTQAVMNLAESAARHTPPDAVVELRSELRDGWARIAVRDTGAGIDPHEQERIFERFSRGRDARRGDGSGLGLAIVRAVAEAHGGRVELESAPGRGATFALVLPAAPEDPPA